MTYSATACKVHHVSDLRGTHADALPVPACPSYGGNQYGAWSEGGGGFIYAESCAMEVANYAAEILTEEDPDDTIKILVVCPDHEEQPYDTCGECFADEDDEGTADAAFDCCNRLAAIPVRPCVHDLHITDIVPADLLTAEENPVKIYYIRYAATDSNGATRQGIPRIQSDRKPGWAACYAAIPGFITGEVVMVADAEDGGPL